jgi:hypothetical protein
MSRLANHAGFACRGSDTVVSGVDWSDEITVLGFTSWRRRLLTEVAK